MIYMRLFDPCSRIGSCCLEGVLDIKGSTKSQRNTVEIGGTTTHGKWSYGSATIIGQYSYTPKVYLR